MKFQTDSSNFTKKIFPFQACGDANSKPAFLSDKTLESSIKMVVKKFPNIDVKGV